MKKKVITAALLSAAMYGATAQVKLGVLAGANVTMTKLSSVSDIKSMAAPTFGVVAQFNAGPLLFRPSVNYLKTGYESTTSQVVSGLTSVQNSSVNITNIEIPLDLVVPLKMKSGRLLLSASPVITVGLKGTSASTTTVNNTQVASANTNINFGNAQAEIKKVDFGGRFGMGYEFKNGLQLNAAYKLGLSNQSNATNTTFKNNYVALTASWFLFK